MPVSYIEIDLKALRHNFRVIRESLPPTVELSAVVKANAYGHGAAEALRIALEEGYTSGIVARVYEGEALRKEGFTCPLFQLGPAILDEIETAVKNDITIPVEDGIDLNAIDKAAEKSGKKALVWVPINTGMNRIGVRPERFAGFLKELARYPHLHVVGTFTHMATADCPDRSKAVEQLKRFKKAVDSADLPEGFIVSAANSAGVMDLPESWHKMARPGIIIYGYEPSEYMSNHLDLKPVMSVHSHVTRVQTLYPGESVGYGATFTAEEEMHLATIPVGYADGWFRALSNKGVVLIHGKRCPILGRICMDQFMVRAPEETRPGDEVVLFGSQGDETLGADEQAGLAGTISYELLVRMQRIPRVYRK
jgi:alanine racemase